MLRIGLVLQFQNCYLCIYGDSLLLRFQKNVHSELDGIDMLLVSPFGIIAFDLVIIF